ncbi:dihydrofolate reductase family protein [Streptomyces sp. NPDC050560]|uniref:dihydrofolate reductase family protein n=1 Tax=Streptomyces sp. NPDC050560 TaxID=3365630 RepID=UPI00379D3D96
MLYADISTSLDGRVTGPEPNPEQPLGAAGSRLHEWLYGLSGWRGPHRLDGGAQGPESELVAHSLDRAGALVMGHTMYTLADPHWAEEPPFHRPVFVLTHTPREPDVRRGTTFHFVTDGLRAAVESATAAAEGRDVSVGGGADVIRQALAAGLLDELRLHIVPVLLGGGVQLFGDPGPGPAEWQVVDTLRGADAVHLTLRPARTAD